MLEYLHLSNVGPAPELEMTLAPRLNLVTGDNGLGKSFLLDVAWWALTRKWPQDVNPKLTSGYRAAPTDVKKPSSIEFRLTTKTGRGIRYESSYLPREKSWIGKAGRPWNPGLVIYAHADGGFSVWDPARNYWKRAGSIDIQDTPPAFVFSAEELWHGLTIEEDGKKIEVCKGLLDDWSIWIREGGDNARRMQEVLARLSPNSEPIEVGPLTRLPALGIQDIPTIATPYSDSVPILHASSGLRRAAGLAYALLWSWYEHCVAADGNNEPRTSQVIMILDELESHLHPRWQRSILSSVLHVAETLHTSAAVQLLAATHSPLILASAEPFFDAERDAWFDLDLDATTRQVVLRNRPFIPHGDVSNWLTSNAFDLKSARSLEAERAIEKARELLRRPTPGEDDARSVDEELRRAGLPEIDPFWVRWGKFMERWEGGA